MPPAVSYEALLRLDAELHQAAQGMAAWRLQLGEALRWLVERNGLFELGYSNFSNYALQRCSRSGRWAEDTRAVAKRLASLPALRAALLAGQVGWSMAELVSRHATAETDAQLAERAKGMTVRQMRGWLGQSGPCAEQGPPEPSGAGQAEPAEAGDGKRPGAETQPKPSGRTSHPEPSAAEPCPVFVAGGEGEPITVELDSCPALGDLDEVDPIRTLNLTLDREVAWLLQGTRMLVELVGGEPNTDSFVQALVAEALTSLPALQGDGAWHAGADSESARQRAWLEQLARWREESERRCENNFASLLGLREQAPACTSGDRSTCAPQLGDLVQHCSVPELDARIARCAQTLAGADLRIGELAEQMHRLGGWRRLGFASESQYARERLGISYSSLRAKRALARSSATLPAVRRALGEASIGFSAASGLARVANEQTQEQWVERAQRRTAKHLREEIELAELVAQSTGQRAFMPPTEEQMQEYFEVQQAVTSGRALVEAAVAQPQPGEAKPKPSAHRGVEHAAGRCQMSGAVPAADGGCSTTGGGWYQQLGELAAAIRAHLGLGRRSCGSARAFDKLAHGMIDCQKTPRRGGQRSASGRVTLRLRVRESTAEFFRGVEREAARYIPRDMSFVEYACLAVWGAWRHLLEPRVAYAHIYARDRHRCSCPVCERRDVTPHHVQYRSRGGDDSPQNVAAVCTTCHLDLIHGGVIDVDGSANQLTWRIGRSGSLTVVGREARLE